MPDDPVIYDPLPPHIRRFAPWTWRRTKGIAFVVIAACLYSPFSWLLMEWDWYWLRLWPILPGFVPGALLFHPHDALEFTTMGLCTLVMLTGLTWLGSRGWWRLALAAGVALLVSVPTAWIAYGAYRF